MGLPGEKYDAIAQLRSTLEQLEEMDRRLSNRGDRTELDEAYREGQDWKDMLRRKTDERQDSHPDSPSS